MGNSLEKLIDSRISQAKDNAAERALILGNTLAETAKRSMKKLESIHNAESWTLPADLTVKVRFIFFRINHCLSLMFG